MTNKVIQISFSECEFQHLQKKAEVDGLTIPLYIKSKVLDDTEFKRYYAELLKRVQGIQLGTQFSIKAVFGLEWAGISKGVRLALGRAFYNYVKAGKLPNIEAIKDKDSANTQWYVCIDTTTLNPDK